jgi:hypothetical protein
VKSQVQVIATGILLVGVGFLLGRLDWQTPAARAQESALDAAPSEDTTKKIVAAHEALKQAMEALKVDARYVSATKSLNPYAVLSGGVQALDDLESGRGVDPYTFALLHADDAVDEIRENLARDEQGRLTYKGRIIRIYPVSKLKTILATTRILTGEVKPKKGEEPE